MKAVTEENVDALAKAILSQAHAEADQILSEAKAKAELIRQQTQEQAAQIRKEVMDRANEEAQRLRSQSLATTQLKARTMQLEHREKLLDQVFKKALEELPGIQQWTDYEDIAKNLLREALTQLGSKEVKVHADAHTQSLLTESYLNDLSKEMNMNITLGEPLKRGTGVIVEANEGRLQFDNTLETRLKRMQNNLRSPIYHLLMGETL